MHISCLSKNCSSQITYSVENAEWTIEKEIVPRLYVYVADYRCEGAELLVRREVRTFSFHVYQKYIANPGIYIFLETKYMYAYYRKYFGRFQLIEPYDAIEKKIKKGGKRGKQVDGGKESENVWLPPPKTWSQEEKQIAIVEAKERLKNPNEENVQIARERTKISEDGVLKIRFTSPINFPTYMKQNIKKHGRFL